MGEQVAKSSAPKIKGKITREDLVAIHLSNIEETLIANREILELEIDSLEKEIEHKSEIIREEVHKAAFQDALKRTEPIRKCSEQLTNSKITDDQITVQIDAALLMDPVGFIEKSEYSIEYLSSFRTFRRSDNEEKQAETIEVIYSREMVAPDSVITIVEKSKETMKRLSEKRELLRKVHAAFSDLPRFERQIRKSIAQELIRSSGAEVNLDESLRIVGIPELRPLDQ